MTEDERVPDDPEAVEAAIEADEHALPPEDLVYPTLSFEDGSVGENGRFRGSRDLDRAAMAGMLEDLAGALRTHDLAVESDDRHVRLGIAPEGVDVRFDPGPSGDDASDLSITFQLRAAPMFVADDAAGDPVGARGGKGFVPVEQLATDRESFRCYNWIDDPTDPSSDPTGSADDPTDS